MTVQFKSFAGHEFVVKFSESVVHEVGQEALFIKGVEDEKAIVRYSPIDGITVRQLTKEKELLDKVTTKTASCLSLSGQEFMECFHQKFSKEMMRADEELTRTKLYRDLMSYKLRNYTCEDTTMETSPPLRSTTFTSNGVRYNADILLDMPSAKIWTVDDFI